MTKITSKKNPALALRWCGVLDSSPVFLVRRDLPHTSGANKYEGKKKERTTHAGSLGEEAGDEVAVAAALRHSANVNDTARPVNRFV